MSVCLDATLNFWRYSFFPVFYGPLSFIVKKKGAEKTVALCLIEMAHIDGKYSELNSKILITIVVNTSEIVLIQMKSYFLFVFYQNVRWFFSMFTKNPKEIL